MSEGRLIGKVIGLAVRTAEGAPMREAAEVQAREGAGLDGHGTVEPDRGITLLSARQWDEVVRELGREIPWHTRRANVLLETGGLLPLVGRTIQIGPVKIALRDETRPCALMDKAVQGLRAILKPDGRGGVHGRILNSGQIRIGDEARVLADSDE